MIIISFPLQGLDISELDLANLNDWQQIDNIYGGLSRANISYNQIQNSVKYINKLFENADPELFTVEKENFQKHWPGFYAGIEYSSPPKKPYTLGIEFENYFNSASWKMTNLNTGFQIKEDWNFHFLGITGLLNYYFHDWLALQGGTGLHIGHQGVTQRDKEDRDYSIYYFSLPALILGVKGDISLNEKLAVNFQLNYRLLHTYVLDPDDYYRNHFNTETFKGPGIRTGLTYSF